MRRACSDQACCELIEVGFPDRDRSSVDQTLNGECTFFWSVGKIRAGRGRRNTGEVDVILDREGDAVEGERFIGLGWQLVQVGLDLCIIQYRDPDRVVRSVFYSLADRFHDLCWGEVTRCVSSQELIDRKFLWNHNAG